MPWTRYADWAGSVIKRRIRVPRTMPLGCACFGQSQIPLILGAGAIGTLVNVLPEGASRPRYVAFPGPLELSFAGEIVVRRADNSAVVWTDMATVQMGPDEATVVIPRKTLDRLEIEC